MRETIKGALSNQVAAQSRSMKEICRPEKLICTRLVVFVREGECACVYDRVCVCVCVYVCNVYIRERGQWIVLGYM